MSRDFTYASKRNPCPCCAHDHGCKLFHDGKVWCLRINHFHDAPTGYRVLGLLRNGMGASLVPDDGFDLEEYRRQQRKQEEKRQRRLQRQLSALSLLERDRAIRRLHATIGLTRSDRRHLKEERGLTDAQIDQGLYFSVEPYQELPAGIPINFPGVHWLGKQLTNRHRGIACVLFNPDGLAIGIQIRLTGDTNEGRYRWLKGQNGSHLPNGELPLTYIRPQEIKRKHPAILEGTGVKPQKAAHLLSQIVIGAAGGQHTGSPQQLAQYLDAAAADGVDTSVVQIYLDAGDPVNEHVLYRLNLLIKLLERSGRRVEIAWWNQVSKKEHLDIDELPDDELETITYLSVAEFRKKSWVAKVQHDERERYLKNLAYTPDTTQESRYFDFRNPEPGEIVCIRSPIGTGKTEWLYRLISGLFKEHGVVGAVHRDALVKHLKERFGKDRFYSMIDDQGYNLVADPSSCILTCFDSLHRFKPEDFDGKALILDEVVSGITHLLTSRTYVAYEREKKLYIFTEAIRRAKYVIILDGLLTDQIVDYIWTLAAGYKTRLTKVLNTYKPESWKVYFLDANDPTPFTSKVFDCERPMICTDSQKKAEILERRLMAQGKIGLRIDSETHHTKGPVKDQVDKFLAKPNKYIRKHKPDYLIISPTIENGVDISVRNYFDAAFGFFVHLHTDALVQMLGRLRDPNLPRYIHCEKRSVLANSEVMGRTEKQELENRLSLNYQEILDVAASCRESNREDAAIAVLGLIEKQKHSLHNSPHQKMLAQIDLRFRYEHDHMRSCLLHALQADHDVEIVKGETDRVEKQKLKETKQEIEEEEVAKTYNAADICFEEATALERKSDLTEEEVYKLKKYKSVLSKLPGTKNTPIDTLEFYHKVLVKDRTYIRDAERYWLLFHPEVSRLFQERKWESISLRLLKYPDQWIHEQRAVHSPLRALTALGIPQLIASGKEFHKDSPEIKELLNKSRKEKIITLLGKRPPGKKANPIAYLRSLLGLLGAKLSCVKRGQTSNGERIRLYKIVTPNDGFWHLVQRAIGERWGKYAEDVTAFSPEFAALKTEGQKQAQVQVQQELQPRPLAGVVTNINTVASGRESHTTNELQSGEEKTLPLDVTQEQREEKSMAMLQGLTPELPGEKMKAEMPSTPDRTGKNPRPLATEVTNIHPVANGREANPTSELQTNEEITLPIDVPKEYREDIVEMRSWLQVSVENGLEGVKEIVSTIQHYFEQVPQARPWLWQSLGTTMQQTIRNALAQ